MTKVETVIVNVGDTQTYEKLRSEGYNCVASDNGIVWMRRLINWQEYDSDYLDGSEYHARLLSDYHK